MKITTAASALLFTMPTPGCQQGGGTPPAPIDPRPAVEATNGLGIDLYRRLATATPDGNLFFSPWSVANALAMTAAGARAETLVEMARVLHIQVRPAAMRARSTCCTPRSPP